MDNLYEKQICGLVFYIEMTLLFLIDEKGNICLIQGKYEEINQFKENKSYIIKNLEFEGIDQRLY